jgi:polyisoprenoid-binding protein YceI
MTLLALILALAPAYTVDAAGSTLKYTVTHKLHQVAATSKQVEGKAVVRDGAAILAEVRAPVMSFRSGDGNRDEHMDEAMNVGTWPTVTFKGIGKLGAGGQLPAGPLQMDGQVDLHGFKQPYKVELTITPQADGSLRVKGAFDVSLDAHHVERPSLLFVKIDDACHLEVDLLLREANP